MSTTNLFCQTPFAALLSKYPLSCLDVGSRGGFERDLLPLAFAVNATGFEPEEEAYNALKNANLGPWLSARHVPMGLSGTGGTRNLYVTKDPQSTSLWEHDPRVGLAFDKPQFFDVVKTLTVTTQTLDQAIDNYQIIPPDYLKIDVEGAELEIMQASPLAMENILAVKTEISFYPMRKNQPLARDIDAFMAAAGFILMDMTPPAKWRIQGYMIHPLLAPQDVPYSRGQIMHGDYLYFKDPETLGNNPERLFKLAALLMGHGFFDAAGAIITRPFMQEWLKNAGIEADKALAKTSRLYGRKVVRAEFRRHLRYGLSFIRSLLR